MSIVCNNFIKNRLLVEYMKVLQNKDNPLTGHDDYVDHTGAILGIALLSILISLPFVIVANHNGAPDNIWTLLAITALLSPLGLKLSQGQTLRHVTWSLENVILPVGMLVTLWDISNAIITFFT